MKDTTEGKAEKHTKLRYLCVAYVCVCVDRADQGHTANQAYTDV